MFVFLVLTIRLAKLQLLPSSQVVNTSEIYQTEQVNDTKFNVVDCKGDELLNFNEKYVLVIDKKPFSLNNYEETLENLLSLNFIMQDEDKEFNFQDILKGDGKKYYTISKEAYDKINKLENIKGIYTYVYNELDKSKAWSIEGLITNQPDEYKISEGSFDDEINSFLKDNDEVKRNFSLDDRSVYIKDNEKDVDNNKKIQLTIDREMQQKVQDVLDKEDFKNFKNAGVLIMESETGKVKAMVQKDESEANINLGIEGIGYEPGSVFKLITLGAALDEGEVTMNDILECKGKICKEGSHGKLTVRNALVKSCNDIFADIGEKVGYDKLMDYSKELGLFSPVLNLKGEGRNEADGIKPDKDSGMSNISIGQCITVTPIQVLGFTNAFANSGVYIKPYVIDKVLDKNNEVEKEIEPYKKKVFSETTASLVKNTMVDVVNKGTGKMAMVNGTLIGGKTGSATGSRDKTHGWFSGYFTLSNKTYTMTVFVPEISGVDKDGEENGGGSTAAPIFSEVVKSLK